MEEPVEEFSVVIIGAGSGGLTAADFAAHLGAKTALVEANRLGGDCTWTGCVPSKALIKVAKVAHTVRHAADYGIEGVPDPASVKADMKQVHDRVHAIINKVYEQESPEVWEKRGVRVFMGKAEFIDDHQLRIHSSDGAGDVVIRGDRFVVCTGARPSVPPVIAESGVDFHTYETIFNVTELPPSLLVIGGGPIGCELGQAFARFGSRVTILSRRILAKEDDDARAVMARVFAEEGIEHISAHVSKVENTESGQIKVTADDGSEIVVDSLLVAAGRAPVVESLNLPAARVEFSADGIDTNQYLQTSRKHIYAAGDCAGSEQFTHYAGWQAFMAVRNFILPSHSRGKSHIVPRCTFTDPEVASVGMTEKEFTDTYGAKGRVFKWPLSKIDRAVTEGEETAGFYKIMFTPDNKLRGACFVCQRAGELVNEIALCMANDIKVPDLGKAMHNYPSFGVGLQQMCADVAVEGLLTGLTGRIVNWLKRT
ncbi:hypothetical protein PTSG_11256 [Salpingoeca rosetta]|uniref:Mercuric reductase n=1 Tax=Salpingoeca rosetta (strain ATCC 50818 / BSB-021) TaxID=946362 RepID=F2USV9_SALR5|nr:uncharacterized protein PTSG_11256 [Salpingoeca rosetta]EGD81218.1 hypothetical protein PTSG_11256 [Salpingoeca rosetta]|eukprot:XP_004987752.1 hypothetical protein PTSG_11256 [Salpingoeca rosetta]